MSREFYVPCQPYAYPCGSGASEGVVSVNGVAGGMDCMPLRPGPFHYLISEQAKSLVALQELQNEVGALLEFRDLVIETFPNLRHKMAVTAAAAASTGASSAGTGQPSVLMSSSQGSHIPLPLSSQSPSSRRIGEWEPGKVRRRVAQSRENESSTSSLPRSRSNSHSGGNKHSATVQDSGFSTETSSKDSTSTAIPRPQSPSGSGASRPGAGAHLDEAPDELWNLLDVIHRQGVRLREEVESLQGRLESVASEDLDVPSDILEAVRKVTQHPEHLEHHHHHHRLDHRFDSRDDEEDDDDLLLDEDETSTPRLALLQREKLQLQDKVSQLEAETLSSRARAQELQAELATLSALRNELEERLRAALEAAEPGNAAGILAPDAHRIQPIEPSQPLLQSPRASGTALNIRSKDSAFASVVAGGPSGKAHKNRFRTRTIEKNVLANVAGVSRSIEDVHSAAAGATSSVTERRARLGALDSVLISPTRVPAKFQLQRADVDARKIAAILRERSPLELQRHLITSTVHNQVLQKRLDEVEKSTETLSERLGKANEENEDLRFQLAERNIELEGTRARVRVLERLQQRPATENDADDESDPQPHHNGHQQNGLEPGSSSAESSRELPTSHSHTNGMLPSPDAQQSQLKPSPRRRPSRIPLLGATKATAPKPPNSSGGSTSVGHRRNDSKDSLKSLTAQKNGSISNPSISSSGNSRHGVATKTGRDSSRESLNKSSLTKSREPTSRSLPRNNSGCRDSLGKQQNGGSLSRPRDSLESCNGQQQAAPGTPPRRPPAPARRSQSQAARPLTSSSSGPSIADGGSVADTAGKRKVFSEMARDTHKSSRSLALALRRSLSLQSSNPPSSWFSSGVSLYPDSLDSSNGDRKDNIDDEEDETSSRTGSTRVEFIIGSPTRKRLIQTPWSVPRYFDSIDTGTAFADDGADEDYVGEALAEFDSLEGAERLESDS